MKKIITISRECGSGGRQIGKKLAEKLGYAYYDKELIDRVAKESGLAKDFIEEQGEHITGSLLFNIASNMTYAGMVFGGNMLPLQDQLFVVQSDIIKDIANKENCVIVGRCADFILKDYPDALHVFIHGNMENKAERAVSEYGFQKDDVEKTLRKRDKARANHYKYYTDCEWGKAQNYDMTLNSSTFGIDGCVELLYDVAVR
ncbi:MAG: cytidylate kinase-like family protein [Lachnospiraceae bacterium]|jgi:cytidylate kinase|nr:cytidylate kinase-like family protein [Lachnospiraceae bacterium]MCR5530572.1 cytidylate kinase-like family protein [Lachnospiraceae bacterium]